MTQIVPAQLAEGIHDLQALLGSRATTSTIQREHHSAGESYHIPALPDVVCFPRDTEEVSKIVTISAQYGLPVIPFGAGTSVEGHVNALYGGITVDMRNMDKLLRVSVDDLDATVQAGMTRKQLEKALCNTGTTFFVDPGADATIGGMTATRASGTTTVRYGTMADNVLGLTVVLADGQVIKTGTRARKSSAGYNLTSLFVGSEGTLGVITEVTLRLHALPESVATCTCSFDSIEGAVRSVIAIIQLGIPVARLEFLDTSQIVAVNKYSRTHLPVAPTLFIEFHDYNDTHVSDHATCVQSLVGEHGGEKFKWANAPEARNTLWKARHDAYHATMALRPGCKVWTTDVCVPISQLAECILQTKHDLEHTTFPTTIVGHVGDGNFHVVCAIDPMSEAELDEAKQLVERLVLRALAMGGTCSGEHGVGYGKSHYLEAEHGLALKTMRSIKQCLDPQNRMNPGKILQVEHVRSEGRTVSPNAG
jgi:D-lactate dehydrogenase (cytochrome)